ncbi:MAG: alpha/beta fold hydrolase [Dehalococcoidia bacterium]|nr:MAG: alpha/beta fold hydrolase [Dehalococcoidia bacterium]
MVGRRLLLLGGLSVGAVAALWAYARSLVGRCENLDLADASKPGEMIRLEDAAIHYVDRGQGQPLVLIHGLGGRIYNFRYNIPVLSKHLRVVALDLRGFGYSERPAAGDYSLTAQARLVSELMDRLSIPRAAVLGHSMGAAIALRLAVTYPERVDRLILVGSAPPNGMVPRFAASRLLRPLLRLGTALVLHQPRLREEVLRQGFYDPAFLSPEMLEEFRRSASIRGSTNAIASLLSDVARDEPVDLSRVSQPVLLLWGEGDRWTNLRLARQLADELPDARLQVIDRARHMVLEERAEEANEAILAFLSGGST